MMPTAGIDDRKHRLEGPAFGKRSRLQIVTPLIRFISKIVFKSMPRPVKRSFTIEGHRTSISLEAPFWEALKDVARIKRMPVAQLVQAIDRDRGQGGLSSAVRIWLLDYFRSGTGGDAAADGTREPTPPSTDRRGST